MRLALLLACATLSAQNAPSGIEKEKALGAQVAAEYRRQQRVLDASPVNGYLNELGQRLAGQAPETGFNYTFELVDDDNTWIHEAAAFPGGPIFVPAGLVLAAADEDELAGMLAHSIAHIASRQETRQIAQGQFSHQATVPVIVMGGWSGYAIRQGSPLPAGFLSFQRKNELESDQLAVRILSSAGYDPQGLARYIGRVQPADPLPGNATAPYPDKDQRLAALQSAIRQLPPTTYATHPALEAIQQDVQQLSVRPTKTPPRLAR